MPSPDPQYLELLNDKQREAVLHDGTSLLILAGAGSGKTRVITTKIAYLIDQLGVSPSSILAVTFTNRAAGEMRDRAAAMIDGGDRVMVRTFHSFGAWVLRRFAQDFGMESHFVIYDDDDSLTLLHGLYPEYSRRELSPFAKMISRAKDFYLSSEDDLSDISADPDLPGMYIGYEKKLRNVGNADFGDLILLVAQALNEDTNVRRYVRDRFRVVLVDEYQDSNVAQHSLLKGLKGENTYLCVVGDDDQSIYRFRGAEVRNILTFGQSFPGTDMIKLEQNYRSTSTILDLATKVVSNNSGRLGKTLWTDSTGGSKPILAFLPNQEDEALYCANLVSDGSYGETAILYRMNAQSLAFETLFMRMDIPYRIVGALRFYDREEVKDVLAYLALLVNPRDEVSFKRVVNKPSRGIGKTSMNKILVLSDDGDLIKAALKASVSLSGKAGKGAATFHSLITTLSSELEVLPLSELVEHVVGITGLLEYHRDQDEVSGTQKVQNLEQIVNAAADYSSGADGLAEFLEMIALDRSRSEERGADGRERVTLITMHNTKGLEFDRVVVTGLEDGVFPRNGEDDDEEDMEEERRILYVSITRARKELYLTSCRRRRIWGRTMALSPSRFLDEFPRDLVQVVGDDPPSAGSYTQGTQVYHDDYGSGVVSACYRRGSETVIEVHFETGRIATFLPEYTSALEKIESDW